MNKSPEKIDFTEIISEHSDNLDLGDALEASGRVSELVGETASEQIPQSRSQGQQKQDDTSQSGFSSISDKIAKLLFGAKTQSQKSKKLPKPTIQKVKVKKAIVKETRRLVKEATKLQQSKNFSAHKMEELIMKIRNLQKILFGMVDATVNQVEKLYRKYVLREN